MVLKEVQRGIKVCNEVMGSITRTGMSSRDVRMIEEGSTLWEKSRVLQLSRARRNKFRTYGRFELFTKETLFRLQRISVPRTGDI